MYLYLGHTPVIYRRNYTVSTYKCNFFPSLFLVFPKASSAKRLLGVA